MTVKRGYSIYIRPILYIFDLLIISFYAYFFFTNDIVNLTFLIISWVFLSIYFSFYNVYRFTKIIKIVSLLSSLFFVFTLLIFSFLYISDSDINYKKVFRFCVSLYFLFSVWRIFLHIILKKYRIITGSNYKKVIIIGSSEATRELQDFFNRELGFGYKFMGYFSDNNESSKLGSIKQSYDIIRMELQVI